MHRDQYGLIVQADGDGGDTCQRTGMYWFGRFLLDGKALEQTAREFLAEAAQLEISPGVLVRHPHQQNFVPGETFRSDPKRTSRDQQDPLVVALGALEPDRAMLTRIFRAHAKRFFKYQNADIANPSTFGIYIRAFRKWWLWPLLLVTDLGFLFGSLAVWTQTNPDDVDDLNNVVRLSQAWAVMPTPVSWLARRLYAKWRPKTYGSYVGEYQERGQTYKYPGESNHIQGSLVWYFRPQALGNPEIAETYRPVVARIF